MRQAEDFRTESKALLALLEANGVNRLREKTQFKSWTINAVIQHLYFWNQMAGLQLTDEDELSKRLSEVMSFKEGMRAYERKHLGDLSGAELVQIWDEDVDRTADLFAAANPKDRLKWAGPEMSARSSITARLMETWAHGQAVYDHFGVERDNTDRIENIVILGVNTFGWTYKARNETPPGPMPYLELISPSGEVWLFGERSHNERITGSAEAFCQVVTQTRNISDTDLKLEGPIAKDWMSKAQCFAGPPEQPPEPGARYRIITTPVP